MAASANSKQVFDVEKPGKSAPNPTSRPIIVNHGSMLKDPMVSSPNTEEPSSPVEPTSSPSAAHKIIAPPGEDKPAEAETDQPSEKEVAPKESAEQTKEAEQKRQAESKKEAAIVEAVADQAAIKKKGELTKEEAARLAELEKLVEEQKYFVPIGNAARKSRHKVVIVALLVLLTALVGAYLAVDAGLVDVGIGLPIDMIKN